MPDPLVCTRCGSDAVIPRVRVIDRGDSNTIQDLEVEVRRRPNARNLDVAATPGTPNRMLLRLALGTPEQP
jgi:hypothetical protein